VSPTIIIARQIATRRAKAQLAAQGIKPYEVRARDIKRLALAYLDQHAELLAEADAVIEACPELRKIAERERRLNAKATSVPGRERPATHRPAQPLSLSEQRWREAVRQWRRICPPVVHNCQVLSIEETPAPQALPLSTSHVHNWRPKC
jgi:hypothetical protein